MITNITSTIASGTANSKVSHFRPPPSRRPTKAGAEMKLIAESCVAMVDRASGNQPIALLPRK